MASSKNLLYNFSRETVGGVLLRNRAKYLLNLRIFLRSHHFDGSYWWYDFRFLILHRLSGVVILLRYYGSVLGLRLNHVLVKQFLFGILAVLNNFQDVHYPLICLLDLSCQELFLASHVLEELHVHFSLDFGHFIFDN